RPQGRISAAATATGTAATAVTGVTATAANAAETVATADGASAGAAAASTSAPGTATANPATHDRSAAGVRRVARACKRRAKHRGNPAAGRRREPRLPNRAAWRAADHYRVAAIGQVSLVRNLGGCRVARRGRQSRWRDPLPGAPALQGHRQAYRARD